MKAAIVSVDDGAFKQQQFATLQHWSDTAWVPARNAPSSSSRETLVFASSDFWGLMASHALCPTLQRVSGPQLCLFYPYMHLSSLLPVWTCLFYPCVHISCLSLFIPVSCLSACTCPLSVCIYLSPVCLHVHVSCLCVHVPCLCVPVSSIHISISPLLSMCTHLSCLSGHAPPSVWTCPPHLSGRVSSLSIFPLQDICH